MKYLEAKATGKSENKMQEGSRSDQREPSGTFSKQQAVDYAKTLNVDLSTVKGTGPKSHVTKSDIDKASLATSNITSSKTE